MRRGVKCIKPKHIPEGTRWCWKHQALLPLERFSERDTLCKQCRKTATIKSEYGLTRMEYGKIMMVQKLRCAICRALKPTHIDHDHKTGKVRGILCPCCNTALGKFREDPEIFKAALAYLADPPASRLLPPIST
jgi:hypothetical protein